MISKRRVGIFLLVALTLLLTSVSIVLAQTPAVGEIPFLQAWLSSGHADVNSPAFTHWNQDNPPQIPTDCAKCHSTPGFLDFLGQDGSQFGVVNKPAPVGTVIQCIACHNDAARVMTQVTFPSGVTLSDLGPSARCMQCHQGRASKQSVDGAINNAGLQGSPDTPSAKLPFVNIHYFAAAATLFGSEVHGGYEYTGQEYQPKFQHVPGYGFCINCHDPHTLKIKVNECAGCHKGVTDQESLKNIRMPGSRVDFNGNGNTTEGIFFELQGVQQMTLQAIQEYAREVVGKPVAYDPASYPYFFFDTNGNGKADPEEAVASNGYKAFTPRMIEAAYNYQTSIKDPGSFAHNARYVIELLYDSTASLNEKLSNPVNQANAHRDVSGHFNATLEPWRHWDEEGEVPRECTKCHTAGGLPFFLENNVTIAMPPSNSLACTTCHTDPESLQLRRVNTVTFPSGATLSFGNGDPANLCIECHQGRESTVSINRAIQQAGVGPNEVSPRLNFVNPHYFAAGATLFGSQAHGAYEYPGKQYNGRFLHVPNFDTCVECHDAHNLQVRIDQCATCHTNVKSQADLRDIRLTSTADFDGNGNAQEGIGVEVGHEQDKLLSAIQSYAANTIGTPIVYSPLAYPYWYVDKNGNGVADPDETTTSNRYSRWTPTLLQAAYNLQYVTKDPGAFAHNGSYVLQILYDSIQSIGGSGAVNGMVRPQLRATTP